VVLFLLASTDQMTKVEEHLLKEITSSGRPIRIVDKVALHQHRQVEIRINLDRIS
jgi:hypothetical protein